MACRIASVLTVWLIPGWAAAWSDGVENAERSLAEAREVYAAAMADVRADVLKSIDERDAAERKRGNPDLAKLKTLKSERDALESGGEMPTWTDARFKARIIKARATLVAALTEAKTAYIRAKEDEKASAVEREIERLKAGASPPADAAKFRGKYFKVFDTRLTWNEAKTRCERLGGHLAVVESAEENEFVARLAAEAKVNTVWLGGTDARKEGTWTWVDGRAVSYDNWDRAAKQPNNAEGIEHYIILSTDKGGRWWDYPDVPTRYPRLTGLGQPGFVCEWD